MHKPHSRYIRNAANSIPSKLHSDKCLQNRDVDTYSADDYPENGGAADAKLRIRPSLSIHVSIQQQIDST